METEEKVIKEEGDHTRKDEVQKTENDTVVPARYLDESILFNIFMRSSRPKSYRRSFTLMELVSAILNIVPSLWNFAKRQTSYIFCLEENQEKLRLVMEELQDHKNNINERVNTSEPTCLVRSWLENVATKEGEVNGILQKGPQQLVWRCLGCRCPRNCCASYKLSKKSRKLLEEVKDLLLKKEKITDIVRPPPPPVVQEMDEVTSFGLDSSFTKVWGFIETDDIPIIGLYGMGGVGKTTQLTEINNEFLRKKIEFELILWVVISKDMVMKTVQNNIGKRLGIVWSESNDTRSRATEIFNVLKSKKFVVLLDDIWDRIDLSCIGIPLPDSKNKSKLIFTTRSEAVCGKMEAAETIKVKCLDRNQAWSLFKSKVGEKTLACDPDIPLLAERVAEECGGLPLTLIVTGRKMASKKTPQEWKHAVSTLQKHAPEFAGMVDKILPILKFSYDNLPDDSYKSCFIFCSLYPEDSSIRIKYLIEQLIGKGCIDGFDEFEEAVNARHNIIGTLKANCLLDHGENGDVTHVKMHDVLRDLAHWIDCDLGRKNFEVILSTGSGVTEATKIGRLSSAKTISLTHTGISRLDFIPDCPELSTLLLSQNSDLNHIHSSFFLRIPALKFLDLSRTGITELPASIAQLVLLEYLDLSNTQIEALPWEMKTLRNLKYLFLESTEKLKKIPIGLLGELSNLRMVNMSDTNLELEIFLFCLMCFSITQVHS